MDRIGSANAFIVGVLIGAFVAFSFVIAVLLYGVDGTCKASIYSLATFLHN